MVSASDKISILTSSPNSSLKKIFPDNPIVEISSGLIRGNYFDGIYSYKGVPYGATTEGVARFLPPGPVQPWSGIRNTIQLPLLCPQLFFYAQGSAELKTMYRGSMEPQPWVASENCLGLNIWTPGLDDGRKRPVMVWCHGGGFDEGSAGNPWENGHKLAQSGDVVVVSLNHRLNVFGFLYLAELAKEEYGSCSNVGMLDIVTALTWVKNNIAVFGGDADNVTIFGESGGGWKVSILLTMPLAKGLFHKAIVQSGSALNIQSKAVATKTAEIFLAELNIKKNQIKKLCTIPAATMLSAMSRLKRNTQRLDWAGIFRPVEDGNIIPFEAENLSGMEASAKIPMIIGTTSDETRPLMGEAAFSLTEDKLAEFVQESLAVSKITALRLVNEYRSLHASPSDAYFAITTDHLVRMAAVRQAEKKITLNAAAVYMYQFAWKVPAFEGKYGAAHGIDLPFTFANTDEAPGLGADTDELAALASKISSSYVKFAHSGNPNHADLPQWNPYLADKREVMIFDNVCKAINNHEADCQLLAFKS